MQDYNELLSEIWRSFLIEMERDLGKPSFETWLKATRPIALKDENLIVEVPNEFTKNWILSHYQDIITRALQKINPDNLKVHFVSQQKNELEEEKKEFEKDYNGSLKFYSQLTKDFSEIKDLASVCQWLNPKYTFDSFVIGGGNRLAHAASLAVSEFPSKAYNPLFIYGGVGLGKTHLMHAIGHYVISNNISEKVTYLSSEKFTNHFINAIRDNKTVDFRNKYRNIDVLLIDDIQFLASKEQTQEEFFHTFNALHENNKQIVICSDRPPKEIPTLEERLRSRFEWGLITDIQPPDLETRIAILRKKSLQEDIFVPDDVLLFIAQKIEKNIRELEGALIRIIAFSSLEEKQINISLAEEALKDFFSSNKQKNISIDKIIFTTSNYFKINTDEIKSKKRTQNVSLPRQIAMYLCRELTDMPLLKIGEELGGKDHSTVIYAHKKVQSDLKNDDNLRKTINDIKNLLFFY